MGEDMEEMMEPSQRFRRYGSILLAPAQPDTARLKRYPLSPTAWSN